MTDAVVITVPFAILGAALAIGWGIQRYASGARIRQLRRGRIALADSVLARRRR